MGIGVILSGNTSDKKHQIVRKSPQNKNITILLLIPVHFRSPIDSEHRKFLETEMDKFFFSDEAAARPGDYTPPK